MEDRKALDEKDIVVHVPRGMADYVRIEESAEAAAGNAAEITVQVSRKRKQGRMPMLGVIVK